MSSKPPQRFLAAERTLAPPPFGMVDKGLFPVEHGGGGRALALMHGAFDSPLSLFLGHLLTHTGSNTYRERASRDFNPDPLSLPSSCIERSIIYATPAPQNLAGVARQLSLVL